MSAQLPHSGRILVVGDSPLAPGPAGAVALKAGGEVLSPAQAMRRLREDPDIDAVLLVPVVSPTGCVELCRSIKFDKRTSRVMVLAIVPDDPPYLVEQFYDAAADDCIRPGAPEREVTLRLARALRTKAAMDSLEDAASVITSLASAIEGKDHYTCGHVERVAAYCVAVGRNMGVEGEDLEALRLGGIVHDIGKVGVPDQILNKPGKLTDEEMAAIKRHPLIGHDILKPLRTFHAVLPIVRWHHERPNGTGYPDGMGGDALPLLPRIAAVADVFDALATDRPYRPALPLSKCRAIMEESAARGDLDANVVAVMLKTLEGGMSMAA